MKKFKSVIINSDDKTFTILNGTQGTFSIEDIENVSILNEKASKKGKTKPFTAMVPHGAAGIFSEPWLYVGLCLKMKDGLWLAIYISETKTQTGTDLYIKDRNEAKEIKLILDKIKNQ